MNMRRPLELVESELERMNIIPETRIEIHPVYPFGFDGVVGANNRVYILQFRRNRMYLKIQEVRGFWPSGNLIR